MEIGTKLTDENVKKIWNKVFNIAYNFLNNELEAEDATQEIFIKACNSLSKFRSGSSLDTWIYRIAYNYLIDVKRKKRIDKITFKIFSDDINNSQYYNSELDLDKNELNVYIEQIKIGCTKAMLQCLNEVERFIFIIGNIFEFEGSAGASICQITETAYRQKLSRARKKIKNFMSFNCGLVNQNATCKCKKRILIALKNERINPDMLLYHTKNQKIKDYLIDMNTIDLIAQIYRDNPFIEKENLTDNIKNTILSISNKAI